MTAILIDDQDSALMELEYKLIEIGNVEVGGAFTDPFEGINNVTLLKPEIVFLDIHMPQISGISVAKEIQKLSPDTKVVFVSADNSFATEAFEVNAIYYILKPIKKNVWKSQFPE